MVMPLLLHQAQMGIENTQFIYSYYDLSFQTGPLFTPGRQQMMGSFAEGKFAEDGIAIGTSLVFYGGAENMIHGKTPGQIGSLIDRAAAGAQVINFLQTDDIRSDLFQHLCNRF